jgi:hypothetical protein
LQQFVAAKGVGIDWIAILLKRGQIPFDSLDLKDLEQLAARSRFMLEEDPGKEGEDMDAPTESVADFLPWYGQVGEISERIDTNSIGLTDLFQHDRSLDSPVNTEQMQRLNDFLARNDLQHPEPRLKVDVSSYRPPASGQSVHPLFRLLITRA